ncbi:unnamed protein product [Blepharisma stoltei]|uniref:Uncharacterized protein n=1 Tax=Blepharisma stoltei TaxID=1481888 RepID=A0AAU9JW64_9CILI|nr:unnamed protein product [Blepharisma stoltei]
MFSGIMDYLRMRVFNQNSNDNISKKDDDYFENHHLNVIRTLKQSKFINCYDAEDAAIQRISNQIATMFIESINMYPDSDYMNEEIDMLKSLYLIKSKKFRESFSIEIGQEEHGLKIYKGETKKAFQRIHELIWDIREVERLFEIIARRE